MRFPRLTRRRFLAATGAAFGSAALLGGYTWGIEPHWVELVERPMPLAHLPDRLAGKKLVQISDLHVGPVVDDRYLIRTFEYVAELDPDMLVITGDLMTCRGEEQIGRVEELLAYLPKPPLGCYAALGNHDYGIGGHVDRSNVNRHYAIADRLREALDRLGIVTLREEIHDVAGMQIVGLDDLWSPRFHPEGLFERLDAARPSFVLCHNPDAADKPIWGNYQGWILCGHTHGGQCKPPFFDPPICPIHNMRYAAGEVDLFDGRRLYVNRGIGYLRRVRFNARPEITRFTWERTT